jgi:hypothetical protein
MESEINSKPFEEPERSLRGLGKPFTGPLGTGRGSWVMRIRAEVADEP